MEQTELIPNLFRAEYGNLVAVLCSTFGLANIQLAEDIVSDTFALASETWGKKGIPKQQRAWLYRVAKNRTIDHLRREKTKFEKVVPHLQRSTETSIDATLNLSNEHLQDSQLRMLFACCHPLLDSNSQITLALRVLCGFGIQEIASAFFTKTDTVNKRLYRAKKLLRENKVELLPPTDDQLPARLNNVLTTIYLLFNEGYYASIGEDTIKTDFCLEAMRLNLLLLGSESFSKPKVNALMALMCFHASRLHARHKAGGFILYNMQDRTSWDQELIVKGEAYLNLAAEGDRLSRYHLEAAIAYWHTQGESPEKWTQVLKYYNLLLQVEYSPMAALNRTYAVYKRDGKAKARDEFAKLTVPKNYAYYLLAAELANHLTTIQDHLHKAIESAHSARQKSLIRERLEQIKIDQ